MLRCCPLVISISMMLNVDKPCATIQRTQWTTKRKSSGATESSTKRCRHDVAIGRDQTELNAIIQQSEEPVEELEVQQSSNTKSPNMNLRPPLLFLLCVPRSWAWVTRSTALQYPPGANSSGNETAQSHISQSKKATRDKARVRDQRQVSRSTTL
jgi:hypothetical protein